jgi:organic hydroperoxide reductase OsmC/OhrA
VSLKTIVNGIDVGRQREAALAPSVQTDITARTEWLGGTQTRTLTTAAGPAPAREFPIHTDYPDVLLGSGTAPSPDELFVAALASSFLTSFVLAAAAADIRIEFVRVVAIRTVLDGSDDRGERRSGNLELQGDVDADASPAHLEQLVAFALKRSSILACCGLNVRVVLGRVDTRVQEGAKQAPKGGVRR